jgi:tetratricopeptide (TPR) repeat protein
MKHRLAFLSLALLLGAALTAPAHATGRYSRGQLAGLPPYCADSELSNDYVRFGARWQYWTSLMGENFNRIHHYCQGLIFLREARRKPAGSQGQVIELRRAIDDFNFILNISDQRVMRAFPLWPEMLIRRGEAAVMLGDWALATQSYDQARQVKPDYWPAYLDWAKVLVGLKLTTQARELIKSGLLIDPSVEPMRQAYAKLGGSLKDIPSEPPKPAQPAAEAASGPEAAASETALPASSGAR